MVRGLLKYVLFCVSVVLILGIAPTVHAASYPEFCAAFTRELELGDEGKDVRELQKVYNAEGYGPVPETGFYGRLTAQVTRTFQRQRGISETGNIGPVTFSAMRNAWCNHSGTDVTPPLLFFGASQPDGSVTYLYWVSRGVSSCTLNGRAVPSYGIEQAIGTAHTLICTSSQGSIVRNVTTGHSSTPAAQIPHDIGGQQSRSSLDSFAGTVHGSQATLGWSTTAMASCQLSGNGIDISVPANGSRVVELPTSGATYRLECMGIDRQKHARTVTLVPVPPTPPPTPPSPAPSAPPGDSSHTPFFRGEPTGIQSGASATLSWQGPLSSTCSLSGGAYNQLAVNLSGSLNVSPTVTTVYTLICMGVDGSKVSEKYRASVTISVSGSSSGESFFRSDKTSITLGESVTLSWNSVNASYCTLPVPGYTIPLRLGPSGTHSLAPTKTPETSYTIQCFNAAGTLLYTADVKIRVAAIDASFTSNFSSVPVGYSVTLSWKIPNASSCTIHATATTASHTWTILENAPGQGSTSAMVSIPLRFVLSCKNSLGHAFISRDVTVNTEYQVP